MMRFSAILSFQASVLLLASIGGFASAAEENNKACFDGTSGFSQTDWEYCQQIQPGMFMYYTPFPDEGNLMLGLHATHDTFGWTSLALAGNGGMKGAAQIVVRREDGEWIAEDRHSTDYATPMMDDSQDVKLLFADQTAAGETSWGVLMPMDSCDSDDYPVQDISVFMHWAVGSDHNFGFHGTRRGQFHANLMRAPKVLPSTEGLPYIDIQMPDVPVELGPGGTDPSNPYICTFFDLNQMTPENVDGPTELGAKKVHITRFNPILDEDSEAYVHHMILYACDVDGDGDDDDYDDDGEPISFEHLGIIPNCESMPSGCSLMRWPWAVGSQDIVLPKDVGLPFAGQQNWVVLQMHYYNPALDAGVKDSSGVRAFFTTELRPQEAGVFEFNGGTSPFQRDNLPAGESDITLPPMIIPSECTSNNWATPLNIIGVAHHMHLSGLLMDINVERDGRSLGPLRNEKLYDFNHQSLEESALGQLLPGDQLVMNCHYDTTRLSEDVSFGDLTQQEMCYSAMMYYPVQEESSYGYLPIRINATACYSAGSGPFSDVSACAQSYYENVPKFFRFESPFDYDALTMCNAEWYATELEPYLSACPDDCWKTRNCTSEEVTAYGQSQICANGCLDAGVSTYPDVSKTVPYVSGTYGCVAEGSDDWAIWLPADMEIHSNSTCTARGDLSQIIEFSEAVFRGGEITADDGADEPADLKSDGHQKSGSLFIGLVMAVVSTLCMHML